jgi:phosphoglycolate phosphatase
VAVFDAVLFDWEGTIVDFQWRLAQAEVELRGVLSDLGFDLTLFADDNYAVLRSRALDLARSSGVHAEIERRFGEIYDRYDQDAATRWGLQDGAGELLGSLRSSGRSLALVSNVGRRTIGEVLDRFGLTGVFEAVVTRNEVARAKPSGEGLRKALSALGADPSRAIFVGDSLSDLFAARDAGLTVAIVVGGENRPEEIARHGPDYILAALGELAGVVAGRR